MLMTALVTVRATSTDRNAPTRFSTADRPTATFGRSAPVAMDVAIALPVSWKPFVKSNASATTTTRTSTRVAVVMRPSLGPWNDHRQGRAAEFSQSSPGHLSPRMRPSGGPSGTPHPSVDVRGRRGPRSTLRWPIRRIAQPTTGGPNTLLAAEPDRATALDTHQFEEGEVEEAQGGCSRGPRRPSWAGAPRRA